MLVTFYQNVFKKLLETYQGRAKTILLSGSGIEYDPQNFQNQEFLFLNFTSQNSWKGDWLFTTQPRLLMTLGKKPFENIVGKGENAGNQHFLLFPRYFLSI